MSSYDVAIVGGGIIGCSIARELARYDLKTIVIEAHSDVGVGTTKANGGLIHSGYDPAPCTMKARVNARGNHLYTQWSEELGFTFRRNGSMVLGFSEDDLAHIKKLYANGAANGVSSLEIIGQERIQDLEPQASPEATCALYCPHTGVVDPFEVAIAAAENAASNGTEFIFNERVQAIERQGNEFSIVTTNKTIQARYLINAAGCYADEVARMAGDNSIKIIWRQGNLLVFDKDCGVKNVHTLYPVPTPTTKGVVLINTIHDNIIIGSTAVIREKGDKSCYAQDIEELLAGACKLAPALDKRKLIREFAGGRAVIEKTNDFHIAPSDSVEGLINVAGIQSPGVASAPAIAEYVTGLLKETSLELKPRGDFNPCRQAPVDFDRLSIEDQQKLIEQDPAWGQIVCRCETVPEAEIVAAIHRNPGAISVEGVKRRCRAGMGRCQSGFCQSRVVEILARELGCDPADILLEDSGSTIVSGKVKEAM